MTKILREKLCFKGIILTDDLDMKAISLNKKNTFKSINAGADITLICNSFENYERNYQFLCKKIENFELNPEEEKKSLKRILKIKEKIT